MPVAVPATGLEVVETAAPATYTVHSTAPAYQEIKVLFSARDVTTTTYVVHSFFQQVPCDCYAGTFFFGLKEIRTPVKEIKSAPANWHLT